MTSTTDVPRKGDRVRVHWEDGPVARTAEFTVDDYRPGVFFGEHPEIAYKSALGRGFFVIGPGYTLEILERADPEPEPVRLKEGDRVRFLEDYATAKAGDEGTVDYVSRAPAMGDDEGLRIVNVRTRGRQVGVFAKRLEAIPQPEEIDTVPGMVLTGSIGGFRFIVLPDGYYDVANAVVHQPRDGETWPANYYTVVFDPRNAEALPSPFGIKPGDYVKRVSEADGVTETVEFEVNHVDTTGLISAKYGTSYSPVGFEVQNRVVQDRLPAGTITRSKGGARISLRTANGFIGLNWSSGREITSKNAVEEDVKDGRHEVIYLP